MTDEHLNHYADRDEVTTTMNLAIPGMNLRDFFAAMALSNAYTADDGDSRKVAEWAYQVADSMLAARTEKPTCTPTNI